MLWLLLIILLKQCKHIPVWWIYASRLIVCFNQFQVHYTSENVVEGKRAAKRALQQRFGLQQNDVPIVGIISRLTAQKGIHLIKHAIQRTLEWNGQVHLASLYIRLNISCSIG